MEGKKEIRVYGKKKEGSRKERKRSDTRVVDVKVAGKWGDNTEKWPAMEKLTETQGSRQRESINPAMKKEELSLIRWFTGERRSTNESSGIDLPA